MKKAIASIMLIMSLLIITACSCSITGIYEYEKTEILGLDESTQTFVAMDELKFEKEMKKASLEFKADGTLIIKNEEQNSTYKYEIADKIITLKDEAGNTVNLFESQLNSLKEIFDEAEFVLKQKNNTVIMEFKLKSKEFNGNGLKIPAMDITTEIIFKKK